MSKTERALFLFQTHRRAAVQSCLGRLFGPPGPPELIRSQTRHQTKFFPDPLFEGLGVAAAGSHALDASHIGFVAVAPATRRVAEHVQLVQDQVLQEVRLRAEVEGKGALLRLGHAVAPQLVQSLHGHQQGRHAVPALLLVEDRGHA